MGTKQLNTKLDDSVIARLDALALRTGRTKSFYVREAILDHLEDLEDAYLGEVAEREFTRSGVDAIPLKDVEWPG